MPTSRVFRLRLWLPMVLAAGLIALSRVAADEMPKEVCTVSGFAQGTTYRVSFWSRETLDPSGVHQELEAELARLDQVLSSYRSDSVVTRFNAAHTTAPVVVGTEVVRLVEIAREVSRATDGCYDITIGPAFDAWNFRGAAPKQPDARSLAGVMETVGFQRLTAEGEVLHTTRGDVQIDLSSVAQGYSTMRMAQVLEHQGVENYLVELGGELVARGTKPNAEPWKVGIERPLATERAVQRVLRFHSSLRLAVTTSGTYRHFFDSNGRRYSHVLDARTGWPIRHRTVSVTVVMEDGASADAWATGLLCLGSKAGMSVAAREHIAALFVDEEDAELKERRSHSWGSLPGVEIE